MSDVHDEYVAGDINQIDDADDFDDYVEESSGNAEKALTASKVLSYVATSLCEDTEAVSVDVKDQGNKVLLSRYWSTWTNGAGHPCTRCRCRCS